MEPISVTFRNSAAVAEQSLLMRQAINSATK